MEYIVGYTGFVGSNIVLAHEFEGKFNSKNIKEAYGGNPDLLVYAGDVFGKYSTRKRQRNYRTSN